MIASSLDSGETILIPNFYTPIDICGKNQLWAHIKYVWSYAPYLPWILSSDFNSILSLAEKREGLSRFGPTRYLFQAQDNSLALLDVNPYNGIFTWNNRQGGRGNI